jgi:uncharacterized RDD family membrane protein YckC
MPTPTPTLSASGVLPDPSASAGRANGTTTLDTTVRIVTPERIVFEYPLAGPFHRLLAYLVDRVVTVSLTFAMLLLALLVTLGSPSGIGVFLVGYFALDWGYTTSCEAFFNGRTLGKRVVGVRVVTDQGVPITGAQAVVRNVVGAADGLLPFGYMLGLTSMMLTSKFQRLGDLAAGTMVVVENRVRRSGVVRLREPAVESVLPWLPLRIAAGSELSRALSDYVRRRDRFTLAHRESIAEPLARPLRERFGLPPGPNPTSDAVLCAVYHRVFLGE